MQDKTWLNLPDNYDLVVGDTFELFYRSIILANDPYIYAFQINCAKGAAYKRKFMYTPTAEEVGVYPLEITLRDDWGTVLEQRTVTLTVHPCATSPKEDTYILCVGDSLTAPGIWPSECYRRLTGNGGTPAGLGLKNIHFVGGRKGDYGVGYEGYGGWRFSSYNTEYSGSKYFKYIYTDHKKTDLDRHSCYSDGVSIWKLEEIEEDRIKLVIVEYEGPLQPSGVLRHVSGGENHDDIVYTKVAEASGNPFWNPAKNCVDFKAYAQRLGVPSIDICTVHLTWNAFYSPIEKIEEEARTFIENLHRDYPQCRILLVGPTTTASQDGLGINYGTSWNYYEKMEFAFRLDALYRAIAADYSFIHYAHAAGQFDAEYNYPTIERPVNARATQTETIQANGLHPTEQGYLQLADIYFRSLNAMLQNSN